MMMMALLVPYAWPYFISRDLYFAFRPFSGPSHAHILTKACGQARYYYYNHTKYYCCCYFFRQKKGLFEGFNMLKSLPKFAEN